MQVSNKKSDKCAQYVLKVRLLLPLKIKSLTILDKSPKILKTGVLVHPLSYATLTFWPKKAKTGQILA